MLTEGIKDPESFRKWLEQNHKTATECFIRLKRGRPVDDQNFWYIDAVEVALCFGWIDSTLKNGIQRFTPRREKSNWTELNKARCQRLTELGLMTEEGSKALSKAKEFEMDPEIETRLKDVGVWETFCSFPDLYQKIRVSNISFYRPRKDGTFDRMLTRLIIETKKGKLYGNWNDYGRLQ